MSKYRANKEVLDHGQDALDPTGPVVGASIDAAPASGGSGMASTVRTGLDGGFELAVPEDAQSLRAVVSPPGGALKAYEIPLADRSEILVAIEPFGGELAIDLGKDTVDEAFGDRVLAVWRDDAALPFGTLVRWSEGHGGRFFDRGLVRIPQLAPATYTVCLGAPSVTEGGGTEAWRRRGRCATGYLAAGSTLNLQLR